MTKSPASFELESSLNINSDNLFDIKGSTSMNQSFSFMPVKSEDMNDMVWNSPPFSSAVSMPPPKVNQQPAYTGAAGHYPWGYGYYGYYGSWAGRPAPLVPLLTSKSSLEQKLSEDEKAEKADMGVQGFASKLKSMVKLSLQTLIRVKLVTEQKSCSFFDSGRRILLRSPCSLVKLGSSV